MKTIITFVLLTLFVHHLSAQRIATDSILTVGFYRSMDELLDNSPSYPFDYKVARRKVFAGGLLDPKVNVYNIEITKEQAEIIEDVIGFSDGYDIYLNTIRTGYFGALQSKKFNHKTNFIKVDLIGKYLYFNDLSHNNNMMYNGTGMGLSAGVGGGFSVGIGIGRSRKYLPYVIDTNTGEKIKLSVKVMRKILKDDSALLEKFNDDRNRKKNFDKYIERYNSQYKANQKT